MSIGLIPGRFPRNAWKDLDLDDFEYQQDLYSDDGPTEEVSDEQLMTPYDKPYRLENWHREDLIMYVGGDRSLYL